MALRAGLSVLPLVLVVVSSSLGGAMPAAAAPAPAAMLQSYAGTYTGSGALSGGTTPQTVRCRLNLQSTAPAKLNYTGRCSVSGTSFSMTGIITYEGGKYTAAMSSNAGTSATVVGKKRGGGVVFSSSQDITIEGRPKAVTSTLALSGGTIRVDYKVVDDKTGKTSAGTIPFVKSSR